MTTFLRLLSESDKAAALAESCARVRSGEAEPRRFEVAPAAFDAVPGKLFAYWVSDPVRETFQRLPALESEGRTVKQAWRPLTTSASCAAGGKPALVGRLESGFH